jgi:hypothetical protein
VTSASTGIGDRRLAAEILNEHFTATAALIGLMLKNLPDDVRTRAFDAVRNGTGKVELRTRVESNETELVLVRADGSGGCGWRERWSTFGYCDAVRHLA